MTPDQIFKAESKLRELKKIEDALASYESFIFAGSVEGRDFPMGNSDLSHLLKNSALALLGKRVFELLDDIRELGVEL